MLTGKSLRAIRTLKGISQTELARLSGATQGAITAYENGNRDMRASSIVKLAESLDVKIVYRFNGKELTGP